MTSGTHSARRSDYNPIVEAERFDGPGRPSRGVGSFRSRTGSRPQSPAHLQSLSMSRHRSNLPLMIFAVTLLGLGLAIPPEATAQESRQIYEVRTYLLGEQGDAAAVDGYLRDALLPLLSRVGVGPVGVFGNAPADESEPRIVVVIPYDSSAQMAAAVAAVDSDTEYAKAAKGYLDRGPENPPYERIRSELLVAMDCMKRAAVPEGTLENDDRVYELRVYESANERLGDRKVDMFNSGEVPIFLDCGIRPIFLGQCVVGPQMPSLTYLTVYPDEASRGEAWQAFRSHPDWAVLSKDPKYAGTVSRIDKFVLTAKPYSQM